AGYKVDRSYIGYMGLPLIAIPLTHLYTIGRYRLLNMDLRIRRNIQYNLITTLWLCCIIAVWVAAFVLLLRIDVNLPQLTITNSSLEVMDVPLSIDEKILVEKGLIMILVIGASVFLRKIYRVGRKSLNRKFYRMVYDYRRASHDLAEVLAAKSDLSELAHNLILYLRDVMRLKRVGVILIRNSEQMPMTVAVGMDTAAWQEFASAFTPRFLALCASSPDQERFRVDYLSPGDKELVRPHNLSFIVPLRSGDKILGAIFVGEKLAETPYHEEDLELLVVASRQAVVAIENYFLYEELSRQERFRHELEIARRIQVSSLPQTTPQIAGLDIAGTSIPAAEVGGDYFDYLNGNEGDLTVVVGDVSGKGISAALYMSKMQGILRSLHGFRLSPRDLFIRTNEILTKDLEKQYFITALGARIDMVTKHLIVTRAGHLPLFHYNAATSSVDYITPKGIGFGLDTSESFASELEEKKVSFRRGDVFVFVTDGVTEAKNKNGDEFGEDNLTRIVKSAAREQAPAICRGVSEAVRLFSKNKSQSDDQTIVVVKIV
ncbi:SpoIIE family protein phosphatase, partial [candidate division KSB1 bacterium]|nr:SpoIIE family protein phosphatase [candidate division KSB1 bacterium]